MVGLRGIVFDLDGVLIDSSPVWFAVQNAVAVELGLEPISEQRFRQSFGQGTDADVRDYYPGANPKDVDARYGQLFGDHLDEVRLLEGAHELLDLLRRRGLRLGLATNTQRELTAVLLERCQLADRLDAVACASEVPRSKPAPDVIQLALSRLELPIEAAIYVGDAVWDEKAAIALGIRFVGFRRPGAMRVESLAELPGLLRSR